MLREISRNVDWVLVGGRWTRISVMGTDISADILDRENKGDADNRVVILMIPEGISGNPGNEGFYSDFGQRVLKCLLSREERLGDRKRQFLFYTVSHLNHITLPPELKNSGKHKCHGSMTYSTNYVINLSDSEVDRDRFQLDAQVQHKLDFVREYLPKGQKVYIFGHSIGSYMMLRILPYIKDDFNIRKAVGLFPTVEKMADSPNGVRLKRVLATLDANDWLTKSISFWLSCIPVSLKKWLVAWNLTGENVPSDVISSAAELLHMNVFRNIVHMSHDELERVTDFDMSLIKNRDLVYFYYGTDDGWCPIDYSMLMQERLPKGHVVVDDRNCEHAFVIHDGSIMAEKLLQFMN